MKERPEIVERTFQFAVRIVKLAAHLNREAVPRPLVGQLLRAGTSIGANTSESQGAVSKREFANKLAIAMREANETIYWLRLLVAAECVAPAKVDLLIADGQSISKTLGAIIRNTKKRD